MEASPPAPEPEGDRISQRTSRIKQLESSAKTRRATIQLLERRLLQMELDAMMRTAVEAREMAAYAWAARAGPAKNVNVHVTADDGWWRELTVNTGANVGIFRDAIADMHSVPPETLRLWLDDQELTDNNATLMRVGVVADGAQIKSRHDLSEEDRAIVQRVRDLRDGGTNRPDGDSTTAPGMMREPSPVIDTVGGKEKDFFLLIPGGNHKWGTKRDDMDFSAIWQYIIEGMIKSDKNSELLFDLGDGAWFSENKHKHKHTNEEFGRSARSVYSLFDKLFENNGDRILKLKNKSLIIYATSNGAAILFYILKKLHTLMKEGKNLVIGDSEIEINVNYILDKIKTIVFFEPAYVAGPVEETFSDYAKDGINVSFLNDFRINVLNLRATKGNKPDRRINTPQNMEHFIKSSKPDIWKVDAIFDNTNHSGDAVLHNYDTVTVPEGLAADEDMHMSLSDGWELTTAVPAGLKPGDEFEVWVGPRNGQNAINEKWRQLFEIIKNDNNKDETLRKLNSLFRVINSS